VIQDLGVDFDLRYTMGDTVGAGVNYVIGEIFFTKNEKLISLMPYNLKTTLYPTIGFDYGFQGLKNESKSIVQVNFKEPYAFAISHSLHPHLNFTPNRK
jgi:hypothetical protein